MNCDEALLLFGKFRDEAIPVLCSGQLFGVSFLISGEVAKVTEGEVEIVSAAKDCGIRVALLAEGLTFEYREPRDFPDFAKDLSQDVQSAMALVIGFPDRGLMPFSERVIVIERFRIKSTE